MAAPLPNTRTVNSTGCAPSSPLPPKGPTTWMETTTWSGRICCFNIGSATPEVISTTMLQDCSLVESVTICDTAAAGADLNIFLPDLAPRSDGFTKVFVNTGSFFSVNLTGESIVPVTILPDSSISFIWFVDAWFTWSVSTGGSVTSVSGTANRITSSGGSTPIIDIAATYVGQTSITTVGTITTGMWNGTPIDLTTTVTGVLPIANGGTDASTAAAAFANLSPLTTLGDLLTWSGGANVRFPAGANGQVLSANSAQPDGLEWVTPTAPPGTVTSVAGTANRITSSGGTTPVIDIAATYVGQTSITTLGTVAVGTWQATTVAAAYGGTGNSTYAVGDLLVASASATLSRLPSVAVGQALLSGGVGAEPAYGQVNLATTVTGTLPIANGGTGATTAASAFNNLSPLTTLGDLLTWSGSANVRFPVGTDGQVLSANSAQPDGLQWITPTAGTVTSVSGTANRVTSTGGATPVIDIAATYVGQTSITTLGTVTTGTWQSTTVTAQYGGTGIALYAVGDILAASGTTTLSRVADVAVGQALLSGGIGVLPAYGQVNLATTVTGTLPIANGGTNATTAAAAFNNLSPLTTLGDLLTWSGGANVRFPVGTNGQVLTANSAQPDGLQWTTPTTGTVTSVSGTANRITSTGGSTPVIDISAAYVGQTSIATLGTVTTGTWQGTTVAAGFGGTGNSTYVIGDLLVASAATTLSRLPDVAVGQALLSGGVGAEPTYGQVNLATTVAGTLPIANGGTSATTATTAFDNLSPLTALGDLITWSGGVNVRFPVGTNGQVLTANSAQPDGLQWTTPTTGTVTSVSGTTNVITVATGTTTPVINIAATYVGQTSITTLGTVGTGTWQGTAVGAAYGGTGISSYTTGDILVASGATSFAHLAAAATGNAIISQGAGVAPVYGKIGLATTVSGTLPVGNGGTGIATATAYAPIFAGTTATGAFQAGAAGTAGQVLTSNGASAIATFQASPGVAHYGVAYGQWNFAVDGGTVGNIVTIATNSTVPTGAVLISGYARATTAVTSSGSATIAFFFSGSGNPTLLNFTAYTAFGLNSPVTFTGIGGQPMSTTNTGQFQIDVGTANLTGGVISLWVQYFY